MAGLQAGVLTVVAERQELARRIVQVGLGCAGFAPPTGQHGDGAGAALGAQRRYRTVQIKAGRQILTAADPLPGDLAEALARINSCHVSHRHHGVGATTRLTLPASRIGVTPT